MLDQAANNDLVNALLGIIELHIPNFLASLYVAPLPPSGGATARPAFTIVRPNDSRIVFLSDQFCAEVAA